MYRRLASIVTSALLGMGALAVAASAAIPPAPVARTEPVTDTYFGTKVVDPYRWMEKPGSPELATYLKAEDDRTRAVLASLPGRKALLARLASLADTVTSSSGVVRRKNLTFYERIAPGESLSKLYVRQGDGTPRIVLDPASLGDGGHHYAIAYFLPSHDGSRVAVGLTPDGNEPQTVTKFYDSATGKPIADSLAGSGFGPTSWNDDDTALYYLRFQDVPAGAPPTALYQNIRTYRHVMGTAQSSDTAVFGTGITNGIAISPNEFAAAAVDPSFDFAVGLTINGVQNEKRIFIASKADFLAGKPAWKPVVDYSDDVTDSAGRGRSVYLISHKNAPRYQVLELDANHPDIASAKVVIAPSARVIDSAATASDALYVFERENGLAKVQRVDYATGAVSEVALPIAGTLSDASADPLYPGFTAKLESWTVSPQWIAYDPQTKTVADTKLDPPSPVDYSSIVADEVQVPARDGTMIPLSIVHRKDLKLDGTNPTLLYAYGSYGISSSPSFSPGRIAWFEHGGVFAVAHVRGGGENGEEWHLAGKDANKINTIDDFIDCAKWMIAKGYTSPSKLGARGGSAGGITMGGAITRAPELFAAVLDEIPVSDQLRIETSPNGPPNVPEFGTVTTEAGFKNLYATSAVHHVVKGTKYPAVMLTTGANDPRVDPWQAAKMTAALQAANAGSKPILLRVDYVGGHGLIGATKSQAAELSADEYGFLLWNMGVPDFQPAS